VFLPVKGIIGITGRRWNEDDFVRFVMAQTDGSESPHWLQAFSRLLDRGVDRVKVSGRRDVVATHDESL
jgi:hypothetical protein